MDLVAEIEEEREGKGKDRSKNKGRRALMSTSKLRFA